MYIVGIDGGGTKTEIIICDVYGKIRFQKVGPGLIDYTSRVRYQKILYDLWLSALQTLDIEPSAIDYIVLGLSGADTKQDFIDLNQTCKSIFKDVPFTLLNDTWIILRSGLKKLYGAVAIAGTGTNSAAISKTGEKAVLRSLSYTTGTFGGGIDIAREALYYAFRSDELTYRKTALEPGLIHLFGIHKMGDLVPKLYPRSLLKKEDYNHITALTFSCAANHDQVATQILVHAGTVVGEQTAGVIKQLKMENDELPVVVGGRVFKDIDSVFYQAFKQTLRSLVPNAMIIQPHFRPVIGAYLWAIDILGIHQSQEIENNLSRGKDYENQKST